MFSLPPLIYFIIFFVKTECAVEFSLHKQNPPFKACEFLAFAFISSSDVDIPSASRRSARFLAIFVKNRYLVEDTEPGRTDAGVVTEADAVLGMTFDPHISGGGRHSAPCWFTTSWMNSEHILTWELCCFSEQMFLDRQYMLMRSFFSRCIVTTAATHTLMSESAVRGHRPQHIGWWTTHRHWARRSWELAIRF